MAELGGHPEEIVTVTQPVPEAFSPPNTPVLTEREAPELPPVRKISPADLDTSQLAYLSQTISPGVAAILENAIDADGILDDFRVVELAERNEVKTSEYVLVTATSKLVDEAIRHGLCGQMSRRFVFEIALRMPRQFKKFMADMHAPQRTASPVPAGPVISTHFEPPVQPVTYTPLPAPKEPTTMAELRALCNELPASVSIELPSGGKLDSMKNLKQEGKPSDTPGGGGEFLIVSYQVGRYPNIEVLASVTLSPSEGLPDIRSVKSDIAKQLDETRDRMTKPIRKVQQPASYGTNQLCVTHRSPISECGCVNQKSIATTVQRGTTLLANRGGL